MGMLENGVATHTGWQGTDVTPIPVLEEVRSSAPVAFRTQKRAVTLEDYSRAAELVDGVQQAGATRRWTGSWPTVFLTVDRTGGKALYTQFSRRLAWSRRISSLSF